MDGVPRFNQVHHDDLKSILACSVYLGCIINGDPQFKIESDVYPM